MFIQNVVGRARVCVRNGLLARRPIETGEMYAILASAGRPLLRAHLS
jgi:hypothetical protein